MELKIVRYNTDFAKVWNEFIYESKNGLFLFDRGFMEYHKDRFEDYSLLFFLNDKLVAVLPANKNQKQFFSHAGLTFGGLVLKKTVSAILVLQIFSELLHFLKEAGFAKFIYKVIPNIYHNRPSEDDLYALFINKGRLVKRDLSSVINLNDEIKYSKGTKYNLKKAEKNFLHVERSEDLQKFHKILSDVLKFSHNTKPVHSLVELEYLAKKFPENIKLYLVYKLRQCLGGILIFENKHTVHTQYISITNEGKVIGALDILVDHLIKVYRKTHHYFSFGISTLDQGRELNEGLLKNKESFGASSIVHDLYEIDITMLN
jgi:hypothetical protein